MAKKRKQQPTPSSNLSADKPATLKDLLSADVLSKLKAQSEDLKTAEAERKEVERKKEEEARKAEQKRLDNDFEYLLNNDKMDWRKYKS
ncbi:YqkE family protein [Paenibacillus arenosi]|uniref:YqkE family protein n=1 Tax=Paenibacillus arenosi TaxID=2774142 RepID=A0ABR9B3V1_9BACL|nr:YqkE family protein [Paenibacillus arenosi]MBD8500831.1 YqkE family protein [Paenibacillus arenosi]